MKMIWMTGRNEVVKFGRLTSDIFVVADSGEDQSARNFTNLLFLLKY